MELYDSIEFKINDKNRKIELYLGDITKLPIDNKVDLLLVSAFPNSYAPIRGTLIGALNENLGISVKELSKKKGEDLKKNFNCWISAELPKTSPFKKILCFEQGKINTDYVILENPSTLVGSVFRALFTALRDEEWSMITPILATGNQGSDKQIMIRTMVKACSSWIIAGMPLECMKIVIYRGKEDSFIGKYDKEAIEEFSKLKSEMNWKPFADEIFDIKNDLLFLYVKENEIIVQNFLKIFSKYSDDKFTTISKCINDENDLNDNTKLVCEKDMIQTKKVVLFLTPSFLETPFAVEHYNLALCLSHKIHRNILVPIYLLDIDCFPVYMTLNQWIDCRLKNNDENITDKFINVSESLSDIINDDKDKFNSISRLQNEKVINKSSSQHFDVFISYCHKDSNIVNMFLSFLQNSLPNLNIFFDKDKIKSGYAWQETLYNGINNSKLVLAFLSENYFQSVMCEEEFALALSQHQSPKFSTCLLPIWISHNQIIDVIDKNKNSILIKSLFFVLEILIPCFAKVKNVDIIQSQTLRYLSFYQELLTSFIDPILSEKIKRSSSSAMISIDLEEAANISRALFFKSVWKITKDNISISLNSQDDTLNYPKRSTDIIIAFHEDDLTIANILKCFILDIQSSLKIKFSSMGPESEGYKSMTDFEDANLIIILLNPYYISTKSCLTQLQIALSLHRKNTGFRICPLIFESLPSKPSYIHLLPCRFKADDEIYQDLLNNPNLREFLFKKFHNKYASYTSKRPINLKTQIMLYFVASWVAEILFRVKNFMIQKAPVIYSSYDLVTTNFDSQGVYSSNNSNIQIKKVKISKKSCELANELKNNPHISFSEFDGHHAKVADNSGKHKEIVTQKTNTTQTKL